MTIEEIEARMSEIENLIDTDGVDLDALTEEVRSLKEQKLKIKEDAEKRAALRSDVANGRGEIIKKFVEEEKMEETRTYGVESAEYRSAWLKTLQGAKLDETETRAYATTDAHNAIPTMVANKFFEQMKKLAPMLSEITLMRVSGNLKFIAQGTRNAATKHTENSSMSAAADTIVSVTLGAFEFMKVIGISKNAVNQNVDAFESWLVEMLSGDIARAIDDYILNDATNGISAITYTTANQIVNTSAYTYTNIVNLIALLPAAYDAEAKFLVNKATLYGKIASIVNTAGNPIFVPDTNAGFAGRIMGYPVVVDDYVTTADNALYLGRWKDIVGNMSQDVQIERDASSGFLSGTINYRGYAAFDSKPAKTDAIVRLVSTAS